MPIAVHRALPTDRLRDAGIVLVLLGWLFYTRVYWILQAAHLGMPPCPFYYMTGHPCPFCGGTRSFAYMWRGDIAEAERNFVHRFRALREKDANADTPTDFHDDSIVAQRAFRQHGGKAA